MCSPGCYGYTSRSLDTCENPMQFQAYAQTRLILTILKHFPNIKKTLPITMLLRKTENSRFNMDVDCSCVGQWIYTCLAEISIFILSEIKPCLPLILIMTSVFAGYGYLVCLMYQKEKVFHTTHKNVLHCSGIFYLCAAWRQKNFGQPLSSQFTHHVFSYQNEKKSIYRNFSI